MACLECCGHHNHCMLSLRNDCKTPFHLYSVHCAGNHISCQLVTIVENSNAVGAALLIKMLISQFFGTLMLFKILASSVAFLPIRLHTIVKMGSHRMMLKKTY